MSGNELYVVGSSIEQLRRELRVALMFGTVEDALAVVRDPRFKEKSPKIYRVEFSKVADTVEGDQADEEQSPLDAALEREAALESKLREAWSETKAHARIAELTRSEEDLKTLPLSSMICAVCSAFQVQLLERDKLEAAAVEALKIVWGWFDSGMVVRNIQNDHKPDWSLRMLRFTKQLQEIHEIINRSQAARKESNAL